MSDPPSFISTLCHPDGKKSCGACCGAYNTPEFDTGSLERVWSARLADFPNAPDESNLRAYAAKHSPRRKLLAGLPTCPFVGHLEPAHVRVGCLVHPTRLGFDGRDHGVYDRHTCESYLCATHTILKGWEKWVVVHAIHDSTLYGLVVSDPRFVRTLFDLVATFNAAAMLPHRIARPEAVVAASAYFELKRDWPFSATDGVFGQFRAGEGLDTPMRDPVAKALDVLDDPIDTVLLCLGTAVDTVDQLEEARAMARDRVLNFARAVA